MQSSQCMSATYYRSWSVNFLVTIRQIIYLIFAFVGSEYFRLPYIPNCSEVSWVKLCSGVDSCIVADIFGMLLLISCYLVMFLKKIHLLLLFRIIIVSIMWYSHVCIVFVEVLGWCWQWFSLFRKNATDKRGKSSNSSSRTVTLITRSAAIIWRVFCYIIIIITLLFAIGGNWTLLLVFSSACRMLLSVKCVMLLKSV